MATKREWDSVIGHWTRLASGKQRGGEDIGADDCAFCRRYLDIDCMGCPIEAKTKKDGCRGTPYDRFEVEGVDLGDPGFLEIAKEELAFLKKLRKEVRGD